MRFITMIKSAEGKYGPPPPALMAGIAKLGEEATKAGVLVETGGLLGSDKGAVLRLTKDKKITITDGPFAEAKELVGGYAVYETKTKAEAVEWTRRFLALHGETWPGWEGEIEMRQLMEFGPR